MLDVTLGFRAGASHLVDLEIAGGTDRNALWQCVSLVVDRRAFSTDAIVMEPQHARGASLIWRLCQREASEVVIQEQHWRVLAGHWIPVLMLRGVEAQSPVELVIGTMDISVNRPALGIF